MNALLFSDDVPRIDWSDVKHYGCEFGVKGSSILALPRAWTPAFALVPVAVTSQVNSANPLSSILSDSLVTRIQKLSEPGAKIILRSSVIGESIWDRGTYRSVKINGCSANFALDLDAAADDVIASTDGRPVSFLIQRFVPPASNGEFGNLLRVSKTRDYWEISAIGRDGATTLRRLNSRRDPAADPEARITVRSDLTPERLFGAIGAWLNNELLLGRSQRLNCEWVTDNHHFYLVQIDEEDEDIRGVNPFQMRIAPTNQPDTDNGRFLQQATGQALKTWDKLQVLDELWEPKANRKPTLFFVCLADLPRKEDNDGRVALENDFRELIGKSDIIVRTSVATKEEKIFNLPRTEGLSPEDAVNWCLTTAEQFGRRNDLAFVAHRFIASRASAWARADPRDPIVKIHALWGLPDALQYCPYDIWEVHIPTGVATDYPDYKSDMLKSKLDGSWQRVRVKNELARYNCIGSTEAKDLGVRSLAIAERLDQACHIMWFVGCVGVDGKTFNLPWYWTKAHLAERNPDRFDYRIMTVTDQNSLQIFKEKEGSRARQALALKPTDLDLMRNNQFISDVGIAAKEADVPIILSGSNLAHAYFLLRKIGCTVVTPTEKGYLRKRKTVNFGKLVRDKIPKKIGSQQEFDITKEFSGNLKKKFLLSKLVEEAIEVREAPNSTRKMEELADLFEVLRALGRAEGVSQNSIEEAATRKRLKSGGFDEGQVLFKTGIDPTDRGKIRDIDWEVDSLLLAGRTSEDTVEIPFSFFGFAELDHSCYILLDHFGVWLQISLRPDRIELKFMHESEQIDFQFDE